MSIIASRSMGDVTFIEISEPYPIFSASTRYVAINPYGRMFVNVPNSSMWFPIDKTRFSQMQTWDNATSISYTSANNGVYAFYGSATFSPTATTLDGFTRQTTPGQTAIILSANTDNIGRYLNTAMIGGYVTSTAQYDQMPLEIMATLNNSSVIPVINQSTGATWGAGTDCIPDIANAEVCHYGVRVFDIDGNAGDFIKIAARVYSDGLTNYGTYGLRHYKLSTNLLEEATILRYDNFELGSGSTWYFADDNQTNKWVVGTGTSFEGQYSAYITSGTGISSSNLYDATATSVSHIYTNVKLPVGNNRFGTTPFYVSFNWRCLGNTSDGGFVYMTPTSYTPTGGTQVPSVYLLETSQYSGTSSYVGDKIVFSGAARTLGGYSINEDWEGGSFSGSGWTLVNGAQTNKWVVGTGTSFGGTYSAYITSGSTADSSNLYNVNAASIVHFYRDVTIPSTATSATLTFKWRAQGENAAGAAQYDYGAVVIADTGTTPTAGAEVSTALASSGGNGRIGAATNLGKFNLNYVAGGNWNTEIINMTPYIGITKRIVFTWVNDGSLGTQPPMALDDVELSYTVNDISGADSDGYLERRIIFSWVNDATTANNPPMAIDNVCVYCYPSVPNDKV